ncbi:hypothetical protein AB0J84_32190, partial [Micromonospora arborensis]
MSATNTTAESLAVFRTVSRFITGRPLDGRPRTDAGWVTRGTRPVTPEGRVSRWSLLSHAERAGYRLGATAAAAGTLWGYQSAPEVTTDTLATAAAAGTVAAGYLASERLLNARHHYHWVRPLHLALEGPLRLPAGTVPRSYIRIPRDYPGRTDIGRIDLPPAFAGSDGLSSTVGGIVRTKLGLSDASVTFKLEGRRPHLLIRQTPRPPARVLFADQAVRELVATARESAP